MNSQKMSIAFVAMSLIFFYFYGGIILVSFGSLLHFYFFPEYFTAISGFISFLGGVILFTSVKRQTFNRYFVVPFCIATGVLAISVGVSIFVPVFGAQPLVLDPGLLFRTVGGIAALLLAPCSALMVFSVRKILKTEITALFGAPLCVSVLALIALFELLKPMQSTPGEPVVVGSEPIFYFLYIMIGMPVIGITFLILGILSNKSEH
jgi:hypothetical protein